MRCITLALAFLGLCTAAVHAQSPSPANARRSFENAALTYQTTITSQRDLWPALLACFEWPTGADTFEITLQFGFRPDGQLITSPRVTYKKLGRDEAQNTAFLNAAISAVERCTPVRAAGAVRLPENARLFISLTRWSVRYY